ncbi:MAG: outer membrane beta-barrel protein [Vicinamibacterales bacterium]
MPTHLIALTVALSLTAAAPARADWLLTPFLGVTFGGDTPNEQVNFGGSIALLGAGVFGVEFDAAITPNFFDAANQTAQLEDSNVSTVMGNLMIAAPAATPGIRPYGSAGVGLIRSRATSVGNVFDIDENSLGVNVGGGIIGQLNERVGIRVDGRYFRGLQDSDGGDDIDLDLGGFNFWRATLGVAFRF